MGDGRFNLVNGNKAIGLIEKNGNRGSNDGGDFRRDTSGNSVSSGGAWRS
jgi:hypothetical protein